MIARVLIDGIEYSADLTAGRSIAIPMQFSGPQPNSYDVPPATALPFEAGSFIGDTRRGGSCNFDTVTITPHCNGTHTECIGHIALERIGIDRVLTPGLIPATLISVAVQDALESSESYEPPKQRGDQMITAEALRIAINKSALSDRFLKSEVPSSDLGASIESIENLSSPFFMAIIIRTLPNGQSKTSRHYMESPAPFFSIEAMTYLRSLGTKHLLVDIPSLDRAFDDGRMVAHHIFWDVPKGSHEVASENPSGRTVTEMIFVEDAIPDGRYFLDIQIAPFNLDAAPSRPVLFPLTPLPIKD